MPRGIIFSKARLSNLIARKSMLHFHWPVTIFSAPSFSQESTLCMRGFGPLFCGNQRNFHLGKYLSQWSFGSSSVNASCIKRSLFSFDSRSHFLKLQVCRDMSDVSNFELKMDEGVIRFNFGKQGGEEGSQSRGKKTAKQEKMSRKAKLNELRFYRLKAKRKMNSPNPEVRIRYKLEKAKRKEVWLIEKLRKYELPRALPETYDPEVLTEEERFYLKRTGEKKKHYVPLGRRGVFGGVVLNMHLHWKKHETVKVSCKPCKPGQVHQYAEELARLSKGIVINIMPNNIILFYRGKNYVQPDVMSPPGTLSKAKSLEKYRYEQSLEHTSQFIEKLETEREEYHNHIARYKRDKSAALEE